LLIGLILGQSLEQSLRQALLAGGGSADIFLNSPIVLALLGVTLLCGLGAAWQHRRQAVRGA